MFGERESKPDLKMGIVLATKEAHFVCKSKCYRELLKHHNSQEKLKGIFKAKF